MSLESQITALVSAANKLTSEVANKMKGIDQKVDKATAAVPEAIKSASYTRLFVNSVTGNDSNDGLSASRPKKTIAHAVGAVPDGFIGRIDLSPGEYRLDHDVNVSGKVISIHGQSQNKSDYVLKAVPYYDENVSGIGYTYSTGIKMGLRGIFSAVGVTIKTAYVEDETKPRMQAYSGSFINTSGSNGAVLLQHTRIEINHGPFMHQHASGSFGTCDLRMREVSVSLADVSGSLYEGRRYLMDQIGDDALPYEIYGTGVSISGFSSWAESVNFKHANITTNLF
jgi:hypothetical protein